MTLHIQNEDKTTLSSRLVYTRTQYRFQIFFRYTYTSLKVFWVFCNRCKTFRFSAPEQVGKRDFHGDLPMQAHLETRFLISWCLPQMSIFPKFTHLLILLIHFKLLMISKKAIFSKKCCLRHKIYIIVLVFFVFKSATCSSEQADTSIYTYEWVYEKITFSIQFIRQVFMRIFNYLPAWNNVLWLE